MASSLETVPASVGWAVLREPDAWTVHRMRYACEHHAVLVPCGDAWDAVVVAPLERGLAALDVLGLPLEDGYGVLADYARRELVVQVPLGGAVGLAGLEGVRVLSAGSWLLVPANRLQCHYAATWLSGMGEYGSSYLDPAELREALIEADATRARLGLAALSRAVTGASAGGPVTAP
ncbi:hypothetical protein [Kitasatospora sp. HPMI-4]|uniref:hypothetical protein n=1 Tax=Kitasatospora sp. HPMI-4 TaxID=3448443 RepID=UPI003F1DCA53